MKVSPVLRGIARRNDGQVHVVFAGGTQFVNGIPVSNFGAMCIADNGIIGNVVNGLPLTAAGDCVCTGPGTTPVRWSHGLPFDIDGRISRQEGLAVQVYSNDWPINNLGTLAVTTDPASVLGPELVPDPLFGKWTDPTVPDGWVNVGGVDAVNYVEESTYTGGLHVIGAVADPRICIRLANATDELTNYQISWEYRKITKGLAALSNAMNIVLTGPAGIRFYLDVTTAASAFNLDICQSIGVDTDVDLSYFSLRELLTAP